MRPLNLATLLLLTAVAAIQARMHNWPLVLVNLIAAFLALVLYARPWPSPTHAAARANLRLALIMALLGLFGFVATLAAKLVTAIRQ
jgi:hypothetical protein